MTIVTSLRHWLELIAVNNAPEDCVFILNHDVSLTNNQWVNYDRDYDDFHDELIVARKILLKAQAEGRFFGQNLHNLRKVEDMVFAALDILDPEFDFKPFRRSSAGWICKLNTAIIANPKFNLLD